MGSKAKKTKIKKAKDAIKPADKNAIQRQPEAPQNDNPFDFGGIEARDLKKNLGCG